MAQGQRTTGTNDPTYDIVSVLYHALQGAENYAKYVEDAERERDTELASFFREAQQEEVRRSQRAKEMLANRLMRQPAEAH